MTEERRLLLKLARLEGNRAALQADADEARAHVNRCMSGAEHASDDEVACLIAIKDRCLDQVARIVAERDTLTAQLNAFYATVVVA